MNLGHLQRKRLIFNRTALNLVINRLSVVKCMMSENAHNADKPDHLQRTADNTRENVVSLATITGMRDESKTVKGLTLKIHDRNLTFKPGQWVDTFIPGVDKVGGFSMCSSPKKLQTQGLLDLAVKYSDHPPALWVHTKCKTECEVSVRVGGDVYYDLDLARPQGDLLLIAGGVGVNPLYSMLCHVYDLYQKYKGDNSPQANNLPRNVMMMYSSSTEDELLFKENICWMSDENSSIKYRLFVTKEKDCQQTDLLKCRRIEEADVVEALELLHKDNLLVFICGPSTMLTDMENILIKHGIDKTQIRYEKWW